LEKAENARFAYSSETEACTVAA